MLSSLSMNRSKMYRMKNKYFCFCMDMPLLSIAVFKTSLEKLLKFLGNLPKEVLLYRKIFNSLFVFLKKWYTKKREKVYQNICMDWCNTINEIKS